MSERILEDELQEALALHHQGQSDRLGEALLRIARMACCRLKVRPEEQADRQQDAALACFAGADAWDGKYTIFNHFFLLAKRSILDARNDYKRRYRLNAAHRRWVECPAIGRPADQPRQEPAEKKPKEEPSVPQAGPRADRWIEVQELVRRGLSVPEVARERGVSTTAVRQYLKRHQIEARILRKSK